MMQLFQCVVFNNTCISLQQILSLIMSLTSYRPNTEIKKPVLLLSFSLYFKLFQLLSAFYFNCYCIYSYLDLIRYIAVERVFCLHLTNIKKVLVFAFNCFRFCNSFITKKNLQTLTFTILISQNCKLAFLSTVI